MNGQIVGGVVWIVKVNNVPCSGSSIIDYNGCAVYRTQQDAHKRRDFEAQCHVNKLVTVHKYKMLLEEEDK